MTAPGTRKSHGIDWTAVRARLAEQQAALNDAFNGKGPWAEELLRRRTARLAEAAQAQEVPDAVPVLVARGTTATYAMEVSRLARILPLPRVTPVPGSPPELLGLIAVGGRVLRLFDVDRLCGDPAAQASGGFVVALRDGAPPTALRVASVEAVRPLEPGELRPSEGGQFIKAVTEERVALLDVAAILERIGAAGTS